MVSRKELKEFFEIKGIIKTKASKYDLTFEEVLGLMLIGEKKLSVKDILDEFYTSEIDAAYKVKMSTLTKNLYDKGLIDKEKDQSDGRVVLLSLTDKGFEIIE